MTTTAEFAAHARAGKPTIGYWLVMGSAVGTERIARLGYDYVCVDMQHGLVDHGGLIANLIAAEAGGTAGLVRVAENGATAVCRALDAGAAGVIVPLVNDAGDAARAVSYAKYPPLGIRSFGPMRSGLRIGPKPAEANEGTLVLAMIETPDGLANVEEIARTPGIDGLYIGPSDLRLALGGTHTADESVQAEFEAALVRIRRAAEASGIIAAIHNPAGGAAAQRLAQGFTMTTVASDVVHLEQAAAAHLKAARGG